MESEPLTGHWHVAKRRVPERSWTFIEMRKPSSLTQLIQRGE